ncbi:MAG TPA: CHY zinc finger protein [Terracidiphilus sp.]
MKEQAGSTGFLEIPVVCLSMKFSRPEVRGVDLDAQTRCAHYRTELDIIAIKMKCCGIYFACKECHEALASHPIEVWPQAEWSQPAVLCGACGYEMTINEYRSSSYRCPDCRAPFNPGCRKHSEFYFATTE